MLVCFFSESSHQEVADWRPSDARREGRGCSPLSILLQQRPSSLHPGRLMALQSPVFRESGRGRLVVIPPPPGPSSQGPGSSPSPLQEGPDSCAQPPGSHCVNVQRNSARSHLSAFGFLLFWFYLFFLKVPTVGISLSALQHLTTRMKKRGPLQAGRLVILLLYGWADNKSLSPSLLWDTSLYGSQVWSKK